MGIPKIGLLGGYGYLGSIFHGYFQATSINPGSIRQSSDLDVLISAIGTRERFHTDSSYESFMGTTRGLALDCAKKDILFVYLSSYAVYDPNLSKYGSVHVLNERVIQGTENLRYLILRLPSIYNKVMPHDMLIYRMTHEEVIIPKSDLDKRYYIQSSKKLCSFIEQQLKGAEYNLILSEYNKILKVPADEVSLADLQYQCKYNYYGVER
jgi:hypothetical protein